MWITYYCRYCNADLGKIEQGRLTECQLGFDRLTSGEREDIIATDMYGNQSVRVVCEACQDMAECNPELLLLPKWYH